MSDPNREKAEWLTWLATWYAISGDAAEELISRIHEPVMDLAAALNMNTSEVAVAVMKIILSEGGEG